MQQIIDYKYWYIDFLNKQPVYNQLALRSKSANNFQSSIILQEGTVKNHLRVTIVIVQPKNLQ